MIVIGHQTVCVAEPVEALYDERDQLKKLLSILIIEEDVLPRIPTSRDMVHSSGILDAKWSCHDDSLVETMLDCKT